MLTHLSIPIRTWHSGLRPNWYSPGPKTNRTFSRPCRTMWSAMRMAAPVLSLGGGRTNSAATAALSDNQLRQTNIAAAVGCGGVPPQEDGAASSACPLTKSAAAFSESPRD
jgi:hypothetical protein